MASAHRQRAQTRGLTLIELLMAMAIAAILAALAVPALADLIARNRMAASVNSLLAHLQLARSEAVKRGVRVQACPSTDGETCTGGQDWHWGYVVTLDGADPAAVLRHGAGPSPGAVRIRSNRYRITYQPDGTSGGSNATITFCDQRPQATVGDHRRVILSNVGRPRSEVPTGPDPCQG